MEEKFEEEEFEEFEEEELKEEFEEEEDMKPSAIFISGRSIIGLPSIDSKETSRCTALVE